MTIQWWQILLLTCLAFWAIIDQLTVSIVNNPLAIGMISGIIMGDITTGLAVGATLQLMVLGVSTYGGASMPDFMTGKLMYYYLIVGLIFLLSTLFLGFTKWGKIKLGDKQDYPEYSTLKWGMMIFTSTMSADIIFYSLCEWMMYANEPLVKQSPDSLNLSLTYSLFHRYV